MHFVIFGLTVSSSWGNGHATLWRGLLKAMARRGHTVTFYERDVPYYSETRDDWAVPSCVKVKIFDSFQAIRSAVRRELASTDVALVTSYCQDGPAAAKLIFDSGVAVSAYYDLDTPVTLGSLGSGAPVAYLPEEGLSHFDIVLSYTGGRALSELRTCLCAQAVAPLYGWVDPEAHAPATPQQDFRCALSYLGTYAVDRQVALEELFVQPARQLPEDRFVLAGAQYPDCFPRSENIALLPHLPPGLHPAFFSSSRVTLNVTRRVMAEYGFCPSGRLFEAAACGTPIVSDTWAGLDTFFAVGTEIVPVSTRDDVVAALSLSDRELSAISEAARNRTLTHHTAERRVAELEQICERAAAKEMS